MFENSGCAHLGNTGIACGGTVPKGSPVDLCRSHLISAYRFIQEELVGVNQSTVVPGMRPVSETDERQSLVYYLRFRDRIKIGTTADLKHRLIALPHDEILALEPGGMQLERARHAQFDEHRVRGEWFRLAEPLIDHARQLKTEHRALMVMAATL